MKQRRVALERLLRQKIAAAVVAERLRIHEGIFRHSTVKTWQDGRKLSHIVSIGAPKLEEIVLAKLPDWYRERKQDPSLPEVMPAPHKSIGG